MHGRNQGMQEWNEEFNNATSILEMLIASLFFILVLQGSHALEKHAY